MADDMNRIAIHGFWLAVGVMFFSMVSMGMFQRLGLPVTFVGMLVLLVCGVCLRRMLWGESRLALGVCGAALLIFFLPVLAMSSGGDESAFRVAGGIMMMIYLPFYWLPFGVGLMAGGIARRSREADVSLKPS